jgi:hypothetical protein
MANEKCGLLAVPRTVPVMLTRYPTLSMFVIETACYGMQSHACVLTVVTCKLQKYLLYFPTWNIVTCILCMDFAMAMHVLLLTNNKGVFPTEGLRLEAYLLVFTSQCVILLVFQVFWAL